MAAERGLGNMQFGSAAAVAAGIGNVNEFPDILQFHSSIIYA